MKVKALISELDECLNEMYFNDFVENNNIIIYDSRKEYKNYNHDIIENILKAINNYDYLKEEFENLDDFIAYYGLQKENNKKYSNKEKSILNKTLYNICNNGYKHYFYNNDDIIKILNIIKSKKWCYQTIRGYSQGEAVTLYYDAESVKNDDINIIESLYFGGCSEVNFTAERINHIEKIFNIDDRDTILAPCCYNINDIKNKIIEYYKIWYKKDININDIVLYTRKEKQVIKYYYEKI